MFGSTGFKTLIKHAEERPAIDRLSSQSDAVVATLSGVGFILSSASGRAIRDLAVDGACGFADISPLNLARFAALEPDWRQLQEWREAEIGDAR